MTCYDFSSNDPEYIGDFTGLNTIEILYGNIGVGPYSYSSIHRLCDIPDEDQICVYIADNLASLAIDYTLDKNTQSITLTSALAGGIRIRRCTPNNKLFTTFIEGAKLTAKQLNLVATQLLFVSQEKSFIGDSYNNYYPLSSGVEGWNAGTAYVVNDYVIKDGVVYQAKTNNTNQDPDTNPNDWATVNFVTNGFRITGAPLSYPVEFDLSGVQINQALVWDGSKFQAGFSEGQGLDNLSDVIITGPLVAGDLLRYDGTDWVNFTPPFTIAGLNITFNDWLYYNNTSPVTASHADSEVDQSSKFSTFKNANRWVIPNIPTVYDLIRNTLPASEREPIPAGKNNAIETFFDRVLDAVEIVETNTGNPIKAQLYWNLNLKRYPDWVQGNLSLDNFRTAFWDSPAELYHINMWNNPDILKYSLINEDVTVGLDNEREARQNPYFARFYSSGTLTTLSKLHGYGLASNGFYLSAPECYTTALTNLPVIDPADATNFYNTNVDSLSTIATNLNDQESEYRDNYLTQLRDFAFASFRSSSTLSTTIKQTDSTARYWKHRVIASDYNGWGNVTGGFQRLEETDSLANPIKEVLWKIPKQIIYYNKYAMAFSNTTTSTFGINSTYLAAKKKTRFTGRHNLENLSTMGTSTDLETTGGIFKADGVWAEWCSAWSGESITTFNEADIDWVMYGLPSGLSNNFSDLYSNSPMRSGSYTDDLNNIRAKDIFPWRYRPNDFIKDDANDTFNLNGAIGTHLFNVDYNKLFSEAHNYIPDPRDEYVFRVVLNDNLNLTFEDGISSLPKVTTILDYGFTEDPELPGTYKTTLATTFTKNKSSQNSNARKIKFNKENVFVYIQNEGFEILNSVKRYVITLCVSVPRLKSIGYSTVFRRYADGLTNSGTGNLVPSRASSSNDTDKDLGPWVVSGGMEFTSGNRSSSINTLSVLYGSLYDSDTGFVNLPTDVFGDTSTIAGRNECAVKFTRMGIPSNLWIRLSVLNTDGTAALINSSGWA